MTALKTLQDRGQSIWLDSISRELLESRTLARYIANLSVTDLTSNPTIFEHAIAKSVAAIAPQYAFRKVFHAMGQRPAGSISCSARTRLIVFRPMA